MKVYISELCLCSGCNKDAKSYLMTTWFGHHQGFQVELVYRLYMCDIVVAMAQKVE